MVRKLLIGVIALLQVTATQALLIPADLPDGLYTIPFDSNGAAVSDPVRVEARHSRIMRESLLEKRQTQRWQAKCGNTGRIQINDFQVAKENLQSECDRGETYRPNMAVVYTTGNSIAYFCNFDRENRCSRSEYEDAMLGLVSQCGSGNGGEVYLASADKGYGGDNKGVEICL